ncbi:hypothetical protein [Neobacillus drentensis]|uniref:hypothetical protein n=1 Tax=Neobacillus drentensis TaxID=220684 RepID=UPI00285B1CF1|nr:hypothetical protein [Neobacillus drentensis]MDR7240680.1 hypothetical protein [Neobacillus drentensis]
MRNHIAEINYLKHYFENLPEDLDIKTKACGLNLISLVYQLNEENKFLRGKLIKANEDFDWIEKKASEWMLKTMENVQLKGNQ